MSCVRISDDSVISVHPVGGAKDFHWMKTLAGGWIEVLVRTDEYCAIANEEGKLKRLPVNELASIFLGMGCTIVGPVLITTDDGFDDKTCSILVQRIKKCGLQQASANA